MADIEMKISFQNDIEMSIDLGGGVVPPPTPAPVIPIVECTQEEYDAMASHDPDTLYAIPLYNQSKITVIELDENGDRTSEIHEFTSIFDATDFIRESSADVEAYYGDECGYTSIGANTFYNLDNLIRVKLPNGIQSIDNNAFWNTTKLNRITTIPASIMSIGADAFHGCESLTSISINKPENSISGAPWGASNATINWTG